MGNQLFAFFVIVGWNLAFLLLALKLKRMSDDFIDSRGGDSRAKQPSFISRAYQTFIEIRDISRHQHQVAELVRQKREEDGSERNA